MKTEVVIIGGGIVGCSAAYYLARGGRQVVLLEKDATVGQQASGRNAGGVRQHGRKAALPLAMEAVKTLWPRLSAELQSDVQYMRTGNLKVAFDEKVAAALEEQTAWEHAQGLTEVRMITAAECRAMVPGLTGSVTAGKFCPTDGTANPMLVTAAFARAASRLGVDIRTRSAVSGLLIQGGAVRGVMIPEGEIEGEFVINAAGPWASKFSAMAGCVTPIEPKRAQLLITERVPPRFVPWLSLVKISYLRQTMEGSIIIGIGSKPTEGFSMTVDYVDILREVANLAPVLPWLSDISLIRTMSGITEYTPDLEPYIGGLPGARGLYVAAGFSGEGFCVGPMAGKALADLILGREPNVSLEPFRPERFATAEALKSLPSVADLRVR